MKTDGLRTFSGRKLFGMRKKPHFTGLSGSGSRLTGNVPVFLLCIIWLSLNFLDVAISRLAVSAGAVEIGLLFPLSGDWNLFALVKIGAATLIGLFLAGTERRTILTGITAGMAVICIYNGIVLAGSYIT